MNDTIPTSARLAQILLLAAAPAVALADPPLLLQPTAVPASVQRLRDAPPSSAASPRVAVPALEPESTATASGANPFAKVLPNATGQTLTAPVTINANTSTDALTATQTGTGRALNGVINNSSSTLTALKGATNGKGAALGGLNSGTTGPGGQFQVTNASNAQPGLVSTTAGTGNAIQGVTTNTSEADTPAILGQHLSGPDYDGIGVEGDGNLIGVKGVSTNYYGVFGSSAAGSGIYGSSNNGTGVQAASGSSYGMYTYSAQKSGIYADSGQSYGGEFHADNSSGVAVYALGRYYGVYGNSSSGTGVYGYAQTGGQGVYGASNTGIGVYGYTGSSSSYAGYFYGRVYVNGAMYAASYNATSDRNVKQAFREVDANDVLHRIDAMPIGGWDFQATPGVHHIGPMAQDFRDAFGLGVDDKHIDMTDGIGVSLVAIKALKRQLDDKDAVIAELKAQFQTLRESVDARLAAMEQTGATAGLPVLQR